MDYSDLYKQVEASVVNVIFINSEKEPLSTGTGVLIGDGSNVLTCAHCVDESRTNGIYDPIAKDMKIGKIVFIDKGIDIAILELAKPFGNPLKIKDSVSVEIGNEIFAIGYPYTFPSAKTLVAGNIAAFESGLLKIDTSINKGNSGGPLLNSSGEVIGIVNARLGRLSEYLESIEKLKPQASIVVGGLDPISVMQQMIREMDRNINLGIGYAVPTSAIATKSQLIKTIML
jgi:serine protease Do